MATAPTATRRRKATETAGGAARSGTKAAAGGATRALPANVAEMNATQFVDWLIGQPEFNYAGTGTSRTAFRQRLARQASKWAAAQHGGGGPAKS